MTSGRVPSTIPDEFRTELRESNYILRTVLKSDKAILLHIIPKTNGKVSEILYCISEGKFYGTFFFGVVILGNIMEWMDLTGYQTTQNF